MNSDKNLSTENGLLWQVFFTKVRKVLYILLLGEGGLFIFFYNSYFEVGGVRMVTQVRVVSSSGKVTACLCPIDEQPPRDYCRNPPAPAV